MSNRKTIRVALSLNVMVDADLPDDQLQPLVERELDELLAASGSTGAQICEYEVRDIEPGDGLQNYTVCFFIDGDRAPEHFSEQVRAVSSSAAWELAVQQAKDSGCSSSGHPISSEEFERATEIGIFRGHNLDDFQMQRIRAARDEVSRAAEVAAMRSAGPQIGDRIEQRFSGSDVEITVADVPSTTGLALHSGVWAITDQYGERHFAELDGDTWVTVPEDQAIVVTFDDVEVAQ